MMLLPRGMTHRHAGLLVTDAFTFNTNTKLLPLNRPADFQRLQGKGVGFGGSYFPRIVYMLCVEPSVHTLCARFFTWWYYHQLSSFVYCSISDYFSDDLSL